MPDPLPHEVIRKAMEGDSAAFRTIVVSHQAFAYAVAFRFVRNEDEAEDIVQETFVKLWKNLKSYREEVRLTTWLYRIVANLCLDYLKSRRGKEKLRTADIHMIRELPDLTTPEKLFHQNELMNAVLAASESLTPKQKAVFILRDLEGLSTDEIKEILAMSEGNIKSNLFHARKNIAEKLSRIYQTTEKPY